LKLAVATQRQLDLQATWAKAPALIAKLIGAARKANGVLQIEASLVHQEQRIKAKEVF
jgi:hypothetical protein